MKNPRFGFIPPPSAAILTQARNPVKLVRPGKTRSFANKGESIKTIKAPLLPEALPPLTGGTGRGQPLARLERIRSPFYCMRRDGRILLGSRGHLLLLTKIFRLEEQDKPENTGFFPSANSGQATLRSSERY